MAQPRVIIDDFTPIHASTTSPTWSGTDAVISISTPEWGEVTGTSDSVDINMTYQYNYGSEIVADVYQYGVNNFSVRYGYDRKKINWKWYQPIKNWLKFSLKVLFS